MQTSRAGLLDLPNVLHALQNRSSADASARRCRPQHFNDIRSSVLARQVVFPGFLKVPEPDQMSKVHFVRSLPLRAPFRELRTTNGDGYPFGKAVASFTPAQCF